MNIAAAPADAERAFALMPRDVALASDKLLALRVAADGLRQHVAAGRLNAVRVSDRITEIAEIHGLAGEIEDNALTEQMIDALVSEEETFSELIALSYPAAEAVTRWSRIMAEADPRDRAIKFTMAATETLALAKSPVERQAIVDALQALGTGCGMAVSVVQNLLHAATLSPRAVDPDDAAPLVDSFDAYGGAEAASPTAATLPLIRPADWQGVPLQPMRWVATNRIPADDATILSGDGGGGKTTVALQLAMSVEQGLGDWLGTTVEAGPVIFFSAEEPDHEMRRRLGRVARKRGVEPDDITGLHFHFASPENCLLAVSRADGTMWPTPLFDGLVAASEIIQPALIVVDSIAATFGGNQNDRVHARTFVSLFRKLAQHVGCAVLLLDHPSLSGITSGTGRGGSMDWQNATRARLHLETIETEDGDRGRVLEVKKSNYGPAGEKVTLRWEEGCFVLEGTTPAPALAAAQNAADRAYLDCLDVATSQGRNVFAATGRGYAPKVFAGMAEAKGTTARAFASAQERLFSAGLIHNEPFGAASRESRRIARVRAGQ